MTAPDDDARKEALAEVERALREAMRGQEAEAVAGRLGGHVDHIEKASASGMLAEAARGCEEVAASLREAADALKTRGETTVNAMALLDGLAHAMLRIVITRAGPDADTPMFIDLLQGEDHRRVMRWGCKPLKTGE